MSGLVVGIDPGAKTGVCALNLSGDFVGVRSEKGFSKEKIIRYISELGEVVIIAVDVAKMPKTVKDIAQKFRATCFVPKKNISTLEKARLYNRWMEKGGRRLANQHEKDALVACLLAYYERQNKMRSVEKKGGGDLVKKAVIRGKKVGDVIGKSI
jgi:predicted RNase H-like nuclease (RuvC/YqgF family)